MVAKQTKELATQSITGAKSLVGRAQKKLAQAMRVAGSVPLFTGSPSLPLAHGLMGCKAENPADLEEVLAYAQTLIGSPPQRNLWLPYLGETLDAGIAALLAMEVLEFLDSQHASYRRGFWVGSPQDDTVKTHGEKILQGASAVLVLGAAESSPAAADLLQEIKGKHAYVLMAGSSEGQTFAQQLDAEGVAFGWDVGLIPLGPRTSSLVHVFGFLVRVALSQGLPPGATREILQFVKDRIFAFVMVMGKPDREKYAAIAGAVSFGIQSVAEFYIPQLLPIYPLA